MWKDLLGTLTNALTSGFDIYYYKRVLVKTFFELALISLSLLCAVIGAIILLLTLFPLEIFGAILLVGGFLAFSVTLLLMKLR